MSDPITEARVALRGMRFADQARLHREVAADFRQKAVEARAARARLPSILNLVTEGTTSMPSDTPTNDLTPPHQQPASLSHDFVQSTEATLARVEFEAQRTGDWQTLEYCKVQRGLLAAAKVGSNYKAPVGPTPEQIAQAERDKARGIVRYDPAAIELSTGDELAAADAPGAREAIASLAFHPTAATPVLRSLATEAAHNPEREAARLGQEEYAARVDAAAFALSKMSRPIMRNGKAVTAKDLSPYALAMISAQGSILKRRS